jgi:FixJ family two-component response regulator
VTAPNEPEALSPGERRVLRHLVRGFSLAEIADSLGLSTTEIDRMRLEICTKPHLYQHPAMRQYAVAIGLLGQNGTR